MLLEVDVMLFIDCDREVDAEKERCAGLAACGLEKGDPDMPAAPKDPKFSCEVDAEVPKAAFCALA